MGVLLVWHVGRVSVVKDEYVRGLVIILDLPKEDEVQLAKLQKATLERIYDGQRKNALAYQEMASKVNKFD